mgnify:CR=1 FL=1
MAYSKTVQKRVGLSTGQELVIVDVSPDAATGSITMTEYDTVRVLGVVPLIEDPDDNSQVAVQAKENSSTENQVDIKLWKATNSAAGAYSDFRLTLLCE